MHWKIVLQASMSLSLLATASVAFAKDEMKWFKDEISCTDTRVTIHSLCPVPRESPLECDSQVMTLQKKDGTSIDVGSLQINQRPKDEHLPVASLTCGLSENKKPYLLIYFGNGGNCDECEELGVIDLDGKWKKYGQRWFASEAEKKDVSRGERAWVKQRSIPIEAEKSDPQFAHK